MKDLKLSIITLLAILPLSAVGYYFAVRHESLFFLYEWMLAALVILSAFFSIRSMRNGVNWPARSVLAFTLQFSVLGLFLGPFSNYEMIIMYFVVAVLSVAVYIITLRKNKTYRGIPIVFTIVTGLFTVYMVFICMLWGSNLS